MKLENIPTLQANTTSLSTRGGHVLSSQHGERDWLNGNWVLSVRLSHALSSWRYWQLQGEKELVERERERRSASEEAAELWCVECNQCSGLRFSALEEGKGKGKESGSRCSALGTRHSALGTRPWTRIKGSGDRHGG